MSRSKRLPIEEVNRRKLKAADVFQPRAPISSTKFFAGRWGQLTAVMDAIAQTGLHVILFGERGVGKTSLANIIGPLTNVLERDTPEDEKKPERLIVKVNTNTEDSFGDVWKRALDEVSWTHDKPAVGFVPGISARRIQTMRTAFGISDQPTLDDVRRVLQNVPRSVFIFDEFDRGSAKLKTIFTDLIKTLSDYSLDSTILLVGVADTVDELIKDHASIVRAVVQVQLQRMTEEESLEILTKGSEALGMTFDPDAADMIVGMSQGLPHYTHLIGLHATRTALDRQSSVISNEDVELSIETAIEQAIQSIREKYIRATRSARKEALYNEVILACACTQTDALGYFQPADVVAPLRKILKRDNVTIGTFQKHINEFCEEKRGNALERQGAPRGYKYRFTDPLLPSFIYMTAIAHSRIDGQTLQKLTPSIR